jgi:hypothetical protein
MTPQLIATNIELKLFARTYLHASGEELSK